MAFELAEMAGGVGVCAWLCVELAFASHSACLVPTASHNAIPARAVAPILQRRLAGSRRGAARRGAKYFAYMESFQY